MIDDEKSKVQQPGQQAAPDPAGQMNVPQSPRDGARQKKPSRKQMRPTPRRGIVRVWFGCQDELFSRSHPGLTSFRVGTVPFACHLGASRLPGKHFLGHRYIDNCAGPFIFRGTWTGCESDRAVQLRVRPRRTDAAFAGGPARQNGEAARRVCKSQRFFLESLLERAYRSRLFSSSSMVHLRAKWG